MQQHPLEVIFIDFLFNDKFNVSIIIKINNINREETEKRIWQSPEKNQDQMDQIHIQSVMNGICNDPVDHDPFHEYDNKNHFLLDSLTSSVCFIILLYFVFLVLEKKL
jgi:hypothetical protein